MIAVLCLQNTGHRGKLQILRVSQMQKDERYQVTLEWHCGIQRASDRIIFGFGARQKALRVCIVSGWFQGKIEFNHTLPVLSVWMLNVSCGLQPAGLLGVGHLGH